MMWKIYFWIDLVRTNLLFSQNVRKIHVVLLNTVKPETCQALLHILQDLVFASFPPLFSSMQHYMNDDKKFKLKKLNLLGHWCSLSLNHSMFFLVLELD